MADDLRRSPIRWAGKPETEQGFHLHAGNNDKIPASYKLSTISAISGRVSAV
jgi:hypothetical protein